MRARAMLELVTSARARGSLPLLDPQALYVLATFVVGSACFSTVMVLARRQRDSLAFSFLAFYAALSVLVGATLLLALAGGGDGDPSWSLLLLQYLESFVGTYGVMLALPWFAHNVYGPRSPVRNRLLAAIVIAAAVVQHGTELVLGDPWDTRGDVAENILFAGIVCYTLWVAASRWRRVDVPRPLAGRFLALLAIGVPGIAYDLLIAERTGWPLYPLWYCVLSVVLTATLLGPLSVRRVILPAEWRLSEREGEVAGLVLRGYSNAEIAGRLHISPNTVKTHVRAIFDKSGARSRIALVSAVLVGGGGVERGTERPPRREPSGA